MGGGEGGSMVHGDSNDQIKGHNGNVGDGWKATARTVVHSGYVGRILGFDDECAQWRWYWFIGVEGNEHEEEEKRRDNKYVCMYESKNVLRRYMCVWFEIVSRRYVYVCVCVNQKSLLLPLVTAPPYFLIKKTRACHHLWIKNWNWRRWDWRTDEVLQQEQLYNKNVNGWWSCRRALLSVTWVLTNKMKTRPQFWWTWWRSNLVLLLKWRLKI